MRKINHEFIFQLSRYQHYSASLLSSQDKYYEHQKQAGSKKLKRKKLKDGMLTIQLCYECTFFGGMEVILYCIVVIAIMYRILRGKYILI